MSINLEKLVRLFPFAFLVVLISIIGVNNTSIPGTRIAFLPDIMRHTCIVVLIIFITLSIVTYTRTVILTDRFTVSTIFGRLLREVSVVLLFITLVIC